MSPIRVLVVDDSAFMRQIIARMLEKDPEICVVGVARDGLDALNKLECLSPDVLTLDLEMPKMDGLEFLTRVMGSRPLPVVVVSSWATAGAEKTMRALELGAIDFVTKPVAFPSEAMLGIADELVAKVKTAALANLAPKTAEAEGRVSLPPGLRGIASDAALCCIAASTGGPRALQGILAKIPPDFPLPLLFVQHMPPGFTRVFAERLASQANLAVREAADGEVPMPGQALIAPAGLQTRVTGSPGHLRLRVG
ncbi:MAG: response regulator, partial [Firmicutes bacterium]|nr:response regulator [Bacillota bacterium]